MKDELLEVLKKDYKVMCQEGKVEFNSDKFEEYLDKTFQSMGDNFMEVQNGN